MCASFVTTADAQFAKAPPTTVVAVNAGAAPADIYEPGMRMPRRVLDRDTVRTALVKARATNLAAFRAYQLKGTFPSNTFTSRKLNVWQDDAGNLCAAATIIKASGQDDLVERIAGRNNFIRLADMKQGPLMDWILMSGFTQGEIASIQEPFMPVMRKPTEPAPSVLVDARKRKAEDARLRAVYKKVDAQIVKHAAKSLDLATDRLMNNQQLAWQLVDAQA